MLKVLGLAVLLSTSVMAKKEAPVAAVPATDTAATTTGLTTAQKTEIDALMWESIEKNPGRLIQIFQKYGEAQQKEALKKVQDNVNSSKDQLTDSKNAIVIGTADAAVKLVIFVDPNCPHCRVFELALSEIEKELPGKEKLGILVRQWPILGKNSEFVAAGLIAAYSQDPVKFKALSEKFLRSDKSMDQEKFLILAKEVGFDVAKIETAVMSDVILSQLKNTKELAGKMGLEATPTAILTDKNGARLLQVGDKEELKKILREAVNAS